jgi:hypothetical protein
VAVGVAVVSRPATTRLKVNPPLGTLPVLQYCAPDQLKIDEEYQRTLSAGASQSLIRRIAMHWDWGLCQPLFVARRSDGGLYVVDGQHRLEAARLRGDIWQLPCVVTSFATMADEAAAFVSLNQQRRPLTQLDLFKAALAGGDFEAAQIHVAVKDASLEIAPHTNAGAWKPDVIANIGGLQRCYRVHGLQVLTIALGVLARSFRGEVIRYAGSIFPGIEGVVADELKADPSLAESRTLVLLVAMVSAEEQNEWYRQVSARTAEVPTRRAAAAAVFRDAWAAWKANDARAVAA